MQRLIHQLTQDLGEPYTAETAGHEFYHWRANLDGVEMMLYLTVLADGVRRVAYAAILCEAYPGGMVTLEVSGPDDFGKLFDAVQRCARFARGGD